MEDRTSAGPPAPSPYRGIRPYRYRDRDVFFAREGEVRRLTRLIVLYRGTLLYSDSGTGKSSLINAGIIPAALAEGLHPERIRVQPVDHGEIVVERITESANGQPVFLPSVLTDDDGRNRAVLSVEDLRERLGHLAPVTRPLLIFDQFEEWCTLFEEGAAKYGVEEVRTAQKRILDLLAWLMEREQLPVKVLIAFREDHLAKLDPLFKRCPRLPEHYLRLTALSGDQIYRVIRGPFEKDGPVMYRPELSIPLAKEIQRQFEARSAGTDVQLTEVQIVCDALLKAGERASTPSEYFATAGGVQGILEQYLESAVAALDSNCREPAIALLSRMVTSAGTRNVISEDDLLSRVESEDNIPRAVLRETLKSLDERTRLIRHERRRDVYCCEIASEFLVPWIGRKAEAHRRALEQRKLLEARRVAELEYQRAERHVKAALRWSRLAGAFLVLVCFALSAALLASYLAWTIEQAKRTVEAANGRVESALQKQRKALEEAKEEAANAEKRRQEAEQAKREAQEALEREKKALADVQREAASKEAALDFIQNGILAPLARSGGAYVSTHSLLKSVSDSLEGPEGLEGKFRADPSAIAAIRERLGLLYLDAGAYEQARSNLQHSLTIRRERLGEESRDTLGNMSNLGLAYTKLGRYEEAEQLFRGALEIGRRVLKKDDSYFLNFLVNLADVCERQNRPDEAKQLYAEGLHVSTHAASDEKGRAAQFLSRLVRLCIRTRDYESVTEPLKSAQELDLSNFSITDADLQRLGDLGSLRRLALLNTRITGEGLAHLQSAHALEDLDLERTGINDAGLEHLTTLSHLKSLDLRRTRISDAGLSHVGQLKSLERLFLSETTISDAGVAHLASLTELQDLCLHGTQIGDTALTYLENLSKLRSLCVHDTKVSDVGLSHLRGLRELQALYLRRTLITSAGLEHLASLHALERLDLSETRISDAGLDQLQHLQTLKRLYLGTTRVTRTGVDSLRRSLPNCDITGP